MSDNEANKDVEMAEEVAEEGNTEVEDSKKSENLDDEMETAAKDNEEEPEKSKGNSEKLEESSEKTEENSEEIEKTEKLTKFPLGRIKNIMKMDPDMNMASQEAVFLITKATEYFVECLAAECYSYTSANKKKTLAKTDLDTAIDAVDCLAFLEGALDD